MTFMSSSAPMALERGILYLIRGGGLLDSTTTSPEHGYVGPNARKGAVANGIPKPIVADA